MTERLGVTPPELRRTSSHLNDVSTRMKDVVATLRENLLGEGTPWVGGKVGEQFADDFNPQLEWVDGSAAAKTGLLDHYSRVMKRTADSFEQQDQA